MDALRRLAAGHSAWAPNRDKSRVWLGPEGLFLVWPTAAEDALSLLESDQLAGIPKSPHTLLDLLLEAKVLVAGGGGRETWDIQPPGAKTAIEAVKLANAAILLAGLDPQPAALTIHLLAQLPSPTKPPGQAPNAKPVAAEDSPAAAVGEEAKGRAIVAGIMQIKRREQRNRLPQSEVLEDQEFAAQIDNQHGYDHPQPA